MDTNSKYRLILLPLFCLLAFNAMAQTVTVVSDVKTEAQAAANAALQMMIEKKNLDFFKATRERADSIAVMTTTWHALNNVYHNARSNVMGFTYETALWKQIYAKFLQVASKISVAYNLIKSSPLSMIESIEYLGAAQTRLNGLAQQYCSIVTNGRVGNPLKENFKEKGDGFNFLSFRERYNLAESTYRQLLGLDWDLTRIIYAASRVSKSSSKNKFFYFLKGVDPTTYYNLLEGKRLTKATLQRIKDFEDYWK